MDRELVRAFNIRRAHRHLWKYRPRWTYTPSASLLAELAEINDEEPDMTMRDHPRREDAIAILTSVIATEELEDMSEGYPPDGVEYQQMVDQVTDAVRGRVTTWYDLIAGVLDTPAEPGDGARRYLESMYPDGIYPDYEEEVPPPGHTHRWEPYYTGKVDGIHWCPDCGNTTLHPGRAGT